MSKLTASRPTFLVCPLCEKGKLQTSRQDSVRCDSCFGCPSGATLQTLRQIATLPDANGTHACECAHPEMRRLPDGTYHCSACGSEVLTYDVPSITWNVNEPTQGFSKTGDRNLLPTHKTLKGGGAS